jgi:hypothetical protein
LPLAVQFTVCAEHEDAELEQLLPLVDTEPFEHVTVVEPVVGAVVSEIVDVLPSVPPV